MTNIHQSLAATLSELWAEKKRRVTALATIVTEQKRVKAALAELTAEKKRIETAFTAFSAEKKRIETAIAEFEAIARSVPRLALRVSKKLAGKPTRRRRGPGRPRKAKTHRNVVKLKKARKPGRRAAAGNRVEWQAKILEYVKANPGQRMEHISKSVGVPSRKLKAVVREMVEGRQLNVEGNTRGRTYAAA